MRVIVLLLVAVLGLTAAACYESAEPLSKPGERLDQALLGVWNCTPVEPPKVEAPVVFRIWRFDDLQYYVELEEDGDVTDRYQVYPSRIGGRTLLNTREIDQKTPADRWVFLRYSLDGRDRMSFWVIPEDALKGVEPGQAMATIRRRAADDAMYRKMADCRRHQG